MIVGVDTGGTFTDLVLFDGAEVRIHKVPSTPDDPSRAVLGGLVAVLGESGLRAARVIHGSTVATNALLERKGAAVALLTTAGFEDVIEIGRQARPAIYDLAVTRPPPLVPRGRRFGVGERLDERGRVVRPLDAGVIEEVVAAVAESGADAVAICLLHSYANPEHERALAAALREVGARTPTGPAPAPETGRPGREEAPDPAPFVTASHEVLPEFREYERTSTTVVNAFVGPVMARYLDELGRRLDPGRIRIMASNGGVVSLEAASRLAVQTVLSGPAGGAVGGFEVGRLAGFERVITFDMGGTSTDVSLCAGALTRTTEAEIAGLPIRVPVIDIHTVGAGGGSIASRDPGGSLRVGPDSAGADPGPICYGRGGDRVTVTDANLFLGRLSAAHFLGGAQTLEAEGLEPPIASLAAALGLEPPALAEGVLRVANATMERAIRVISLERGYDPREFTLVCFGGAGGLHAAALARALRIPRILVPRGAGTLSALGMLLADPLRDFSRTIMARTEELAPDALEAAFADLEGRGRRELVGEGVAEDSLRFERLADLRYVGQGFELAVPAGADGPERPGRDAGPADGAAPPGTDLVAALVQSFHAGHERRYGYADPQRATEVVTIRARAIAETEKPRLRAEALGEADADHAILGPHRFMYDGAWRTGALIDRDALRPGNAFEGPAVVVEYSTTTLVPPDYACRVDAWGNLILTIPLDGPRKGGRP